MRRSLRADAEKVIGDQLRDAAGDGSVEIDIRIVEGEAFVEIVHLARGAEADLIVLGMHRKQGAKELFVGTTMERVLRLSDRPVLVVKDRPSKPYERVLIPVDFSVPSRRALAAACRLVPGGDFHVIHSFEVPFAGFITGDAARREAEAEHRARLEAMVEAEMAQLLDEFPGLPGQVTSSVHRGAVMQVIQDRVNALRPDLIVLGTHGRTGIAKAMLGSVALEILSEPPSDVLAVGAW
ncbi:MAG: universal stress protein [Candidatus Eiseniibacteriota bacterium]